MDAVFFCIACYLLVFGALMLAFGLVAELESVAVIGSGALLGVLPLTILAMIINWTQ